jgi:hypothetical protein
MLLPQKNTEKNTAAAVAVLPEFSGIILSSRHTRTMHAVPFSLFLTPIPHHHPPLSLLPSLAAPSLPPSLCVLCVCEYVCMCFCMRTQRRHWLVQATVHLRRPYQPDEQTFRAELSPSTTAHTGGKEGETGRESARARERERERESHIR